jgi:hypothetical protein
MACQHLPTDARSVGSDRVILSIQREMKLYYAAIVNHRPRRSPGMANAPRQACVMRRN